ncbi:MAG: Uncharacterized protein CEO21_169 [Microgenomates group bacterium Gr01-1014_80]|nr:MAG: Uncharacterized protein CEO21_169 [Microgenomates group bacterium Gr01-1014_80]
MIAPGPTKVADFPPLSDSLKSDEPGDTVQVPNIAAYFSDLDRGEITSFYKNAYQDAFFFKILPPVRLNYPPQSSRQYVRDQQTSTFLEEYIYPLRGSLFVNGYDPYVENEMKKRTHNFVGDHLHIKGRYFVSKTTLRFYPADLFARIIVYTGIWISVSALALMSKRVFGEEKI